MAAETDTKPLRFKIGDVELDVPQINDFDMDEWQVVYELSGLILDDFHSLVPIVAVMRREVIRLESEPDKDDELADARKVLAEAEKAVSDEVWEEEAARRRKLGQPAFTRALLQIAYQRAHPDEKREVAEQFAREAKLVPITNHLFEQAMEDEIEVPLAQTPELEQSSQRSTGESNDSGSNGSTTSSGAPERLHEPTGTAV